MQADCWNGVPELSVRSLRTVAYGQWCPVVPGRAFLVMGICRGSDGYTPSSPQPFPVAVPGGYRHLVFLKSPVMSRGRAFRCPAWGRYGPVPLLMSRCTHPTPPSPFVFIRFSGDFSDVKSHCIPIHREWGVGRVQGTGISIRCRCSPEVAIRVSPLRYRIQTKIVPAVTLHWKDFFSSGKTCVSAGLRISRFSPQNSLLVYLPCGHAAGSEDEISLHSSPPVFHDETYRWPGPCPAYRQEMNCPEPSRFTGHGLTGRPFRILLPVSSLPPIMSSTILTVRGMALRISPESPIATSG